ncbi:hypothetical protein ACQPZA_13545 [Pseudonocardia xinjiangensis]|uniref:hypothetical protein n=1 Tax=Pseudonocardia xinjiangensis TaxID=75289 RepID=UPI003D8B3A53
MAADAMYWHCTTPVSNQFADCLTHQVADSDAARSELAWCGPSAEPQIRRVSCLNATLLGLGLGLGLGGLGERGNDLTGGPVRAVGPGACAA